MIRAGRTGPAPWAAAALLALAAPAPAQPRSDPDTEALIEAQAAGALAMLGMTAVPNGAGSTLSFSGGSASGPGADFRATQLGGGFHPGEGPLYVEVYLGWNAFDPAILDHDAAPDSARLNWQSAALTGGIGWDFPIAPGLVARPILDVALGTVTPEQNADDGPLGDLGSWLDGGLRAAGIGGALMLEGNWTVFGDWELDGTLRHSRMWLRPTGGDNDVVGEAQAITTSAWGRLRAPMPWQAFGRPLRSVSEVGLASLTGDQADALQTDWVLQLGVGAELDLGQTDLPLLSAARLMLRYTKAEQADGLAFGVSVDF